MKETYIVTPFAAEKQRVEMTKLKQAAAKRQQPQTISKSTPTDPPELSGAVIPRSKRQVVGEEQQPGKRVSTTIVDEEPARSSYGRLLPMLGAESLSLSSSIPAAPIGNPQPSTLKPSPPKPTATTKQVVSPRILPSPLSKEQPVPNAFKPAENKSGEEPPPPPSSSFKPS